MIGGELPSVGVIELHRQQLQGVELAYGSANTAFVQVPDVLAALASLGQPEPEPEPRPQPGPPLVKSASPTAGIGAVDEEIAERKAFAAQSGA